ncbi:TRAP transporter small permease [Alteribacillus bidgolensis]|uniref:TRAP-type C4-dicarboxylate transport system, small permease component n=1 Tax=Alteribacillus bidgolensis TaxID=930129 RepID=A0A1G8PK75_9BACI|nr:TRAP transporter small permease [Alteribacillus bidgolensis]SDI92746.1 TRAP-type C4-dicarboxylate transport system, small permease component [Alteribacillus bidgolensis]
MMNSALYSRLKNAYVKVENFVLITLLISLVALVFMEVIVRLFDHPTTWSVGIAQLIFMWVIFLGANQTLRKNAHIGIDVFTKMLPSKIQQYIEMISQVIILVFLSALVFYGFEMTFANTGRLITGTSIGYYSITLAVPVGAALMTITSISRMITLVKNSKNTENQSGL